MNQTPNTTPVPPMPEGAKGGGSTSSVVAIVVIVVLLALGGVYYLMMNGSVPSMMENETLPTLEDVQNSSDPDVQAAMTQSASDDLSAIEADLTATDLGGIDTAIVDVNSAAQ